MKKNNFMKELIESIIENVYQCQINNIDTERYDNVNFDPNIFKGKDINYVKTYFNSDSEKLESISSHFDDFEYLYNLLKDKPSRELLVRLITFRLLGPERVRLPLSTENYWIERKKLQQIIEHDSELPIKFMNWKLKKLNLNKIGHDIKYFGSELGVQALFIYKQYEYCNDDIHIKINKGDIVIDAGGGWGDTSIYFSKTVGEKGKVYTFEFLPENIEIIRKNINMNLELSNRIEVIEKALWKNNGQKLFFIYNGPGTQIDNKESQKTMNAESITIDYFVKQKKLKKLDFIKMDIEGSELNALKGSVKTLKKYKPKLAISIYHSLDDFGDIPRLINSLGLNYNFYLGHYTIHSEETILYCM